ncbi:ABC transporter substrate-binding protein [uncultured Shewanella sp.]|uniref:ABC transporter substrate-binding protein n=1 Tax=uncultured Shewanella sp. TaxID=173975 RepID=UPI002634BD47|nr:ABC transporter substrate-binding protein [uncultured Shewanella sp.]
MRHLFFKVIIVVFAIVSYINHSIAKENTLTLVSFGGAYGAIQKKYMIDPYMKKTQNTILFDAYSGGIAEIKAQVETNKILWDVVDMEAVDLERACSNGLLEIIPKTILPNGSNGTPAKEDFLPEALANECAVGSLIWSSIFAFNKETIGKLKPTHVQDVFDTTKFPGKRALRKQPQVNLEWALLADGVPKNEVYRVLATKEGQERAFAKLDTIKDDIIWFDSWSQAPELLNDGGAVMVQSANGRIFESITKDKKPFEIVWNGNVYDLEVWAIVKGSKKKQTALDFIAFATGTKPLSNVTQIAYGPTRHSSMALTPPDIIPFLPTTHTKQGLKADSLFWSDYGGSLGGKFNQWLLE